MRPALGQFATLVRSLAGKGARSLTLFGAIARGSFDPTRQTARSVLVADAVDLAFLRRLADHGAKLGKQSIAAPLVMTEAYIKTSCDTFPLEFIEIQQNHLVVFGDDFFADLEFKESDVRHQCERDLKMLAMSLRQGLLAAAGREKVLADLETSVGEGLLRTLRGMLWIRDRREAQAAVAVLDEIENLTSRKLPGIRGAINPTAVHGWSEFSALYADVEALGGVVDAW
jgi:hypothetical protein